MNIDTGIYGCYYHSFTFCPWSKRLLTLVESAFDQGRKPFRLRVKGLWLGCLTINVFGGSLHFLYFCLYHLECYFMKEIKLETKIRIYPLAELPEEELRLMEAAIKATGQSYAPYSKFHVGAAALLEDGTIITGSNQENAAYPSGLCAERVALFHAGHQYPDMPVVALAIAAATNGRQVESISPCGACRQVLLEAEQRYGKPMKVLLCGTKEVVVAESAESLLPLCFGAKDLK